MEGNKIEMDKDCIKFFVNPPKENLKEEIYKEAVRRAYKDMSSHTLHYFSDEYKGDKKQSEDNRKALKEEIAKMLLEEENKIFCITDSVDWHHELCKAIIDIFTGKNKSVKPINQRPGTLSDTEEKEKEEIQKKEQDNSFDMDKTFSYGQSQKLLNMAIKYVYLFYNYYNAMSEENEFHDELEKFNNIVNYLHMPVDGYVIKKIGEEIPKKCEKCDICKKRKNCFNISESGIKFNGQVWSKFSYVNYNRFRECVEKNLPDVESFFLWELQNWPFGYNN